MMGHDESDSDRSLVDTVTRIPRQLWRDLLSVYYTNTPVWRWIKSGALLFGGFALWAVSNLLLSNVPEWTWLYFPMAYGFVLILWGPLTHIVVVPGVIRLRRTARHPLVRTIARQGSKINLTVFFALVLVLGAAPIAPMTLDFDAALGDGSSDVSPEIECSIEDDQLTCLVEEDERFDHAVLLTADNELDRADEAPYELTAPVDDLQEVVGQTQFEIEVRDENGDRLYREVMTLADVR